MPLPSAKKLGKSKLKKWIKCCPKDLEKDVPKPPAVKVQYKSPPKQPICMPLVKPPKPEPVKAEPECVHSLTYRSKEDTIQYLEQAAVPILMEGMLALARDMPSDPISYLEKFWLKDQHKCDVKSPRHVL